MGLPSQGVSMVAARCCRALPEVHSPPGMPSPRVHWEGAAAAAITMPWHLGALDTVAPPARPSTPPRLHPPGPARALFHVLCFLHFSSPDE